MTTEQIKEPAYEFKIEKGIPLPPKQSLKGRKVLRYPFAQMEVNDSVFIPEEVAPLPQVQSAYKAVIRRAKTQIAFSHRAVNGGVRVWRTY